MTPAEAALGTVAALTLVAAGDVAHAYLCLDQGPASGVLSCAALAAVLGTAAMAARAVAAGIQVGCPRGRDPRSGPGPLRQGGRGCT